MNIYRYKNCVIFNLWNYHLSWADCYPEIKMHAMCIYNVITREFRLFNRSDNTEIIVAVSAKTRLHIIEVFNKRARLNSCYLNPTGIWDMTPDHERYDTIVANYVGNPNTNTTVLPNQEEIHREYLKDNLNPKITRTKPPYIDIVYMLGLLSTHRRTAYLQRVAPEVEKK